MIKKVLIALVVIVIAIGIAAVVIKCNDREKIDQMNTPKDTLMIVGRDSLSTSLCDSLVSLTDSVRKE